jgi:DNA-binding ferritin-like protein
MLAIRELVNVYERTGRPGVAVKVIESIKGQFTGESLAAIEAIQKDMGRQEEARVVQAQKAKVAAEVARKKAMLAYYRKCLTQATAKGDSAEAAKLQAAIGKLSE